MTKTVIAGLMVLAVFSCSSGGRKDFSTLNVELTERQLWRFHRDVRYTTFIYNDGSIKEGLLLRWEPDSILIQPRGTGFPSRIPTAGVSALRIEVGNRIWESLAIGAGAAGVYALAVQSWKLSGVSPWAGVAKLLGPPAIIVISTAVGSGMKKYEEYRVPEGFKFDFERADLLYKALE